MAHKNENIVVMGIFESRMQLERAVEALRAAEFRNADISALVPSPQTTKELGTVGSSKLPEGTTTGGATGALLGGTLGWLVGVGSLVVPGLGAFVAAGPIMGMLAGAGVGSVAGGVSGALIGLGFPEYEAKRYDGLVREGGYLLSVHCDRDEWAERAESILEDTGAQSISRSSEASSDSPRGVSEDKPRNAGPTAIR